MQRVIQTAQARSLHARLAPDVPRVGKCCGFQQRSPAELPAVPDGSQNLECEIFFKLEGA